MPSGVKIGFAAVCDAIYRDEDSGKVVLAGVFSGDILLSTFPGALRVAFYVEVTPRDATARNLDLQFYLNGKLAGGIRTEDAESPEGYPFLIVSPPITMQVLAPGHLELRLIVEGGRPVRVMKKKIGPKP